MNKAGKGGLVVVSRFDSNRLMGKALLDLGGKPLLARTFERLARCRWLTDCVLATSDREVDDPIATFAAFQGIPVYRGSARDVAGRCHAAATLCGFDWFVRICGDSPFIDPAVVDQVVETFQSDRPDIATNVHPRTFPVGCSAEAVDTTAMARLLQETVDLGLREHVTAWFYQNDKTVRVVNVAAPDDRYRGSHIAVDWPKDLEMARWIVSRLASPSEATLDEIVALERQWRMENELEAVEAG